MPSSPAQLRAQAKYKAANSVRVGLEFNRKTDPDIIAKLESVESKQTYIKSLIRADLAKNDIAQHMNPPV